MAADRLFWGAGLLGALHLLWVFYGSYSPNSVLQEHRTEEDIQGQDWTLLSQTLPSLPPAKQGPDLVLLVVDGLRADGLASMPRLSARASQALQVQGVAVAPYFWANAGSLATGLMPSEHGVTPDVQGQIPALLEGVPTLASRLSEAGWNTVRLSAHRERADMNLGRGFQLSLSETLPEGDLNLPYAQADRMVGLVLDSLELRPQGARFVQAHLADPMSPWVPRQGYCEPGDMLKERLPPGGTRRGAKVWAKLRNSILTGRRPPDPAERRAWAQAYACELSYLDAQLDGLFQRLPSLGVDAQDWVVLVGGFGQSLGEEGRLEWGRSLDDELVQVPLLIWGPGVQPGLAEQPWSLRALPGWLLQQLGLPGLAPSRAAAFEALSPPVLISERSGPRPSDLLQKELSALYLEPELRLQQAGERWIGDPGSEAPSEGLAALAWAWATGQPPGAQP